MDFWVPLFLHSFNEKEEGVVRGLGVSYEASVVEFEESGRFGEEEGG
jgi:hypothetical protein